MAGVAINIWVGQRIGCQDLKFLPHPQDYHIFVFAGQIELAIRSDEGRFEAVGLPAIAVDDNMARLSWHCSS